MIKKLIYIACPLVLYVSGCQSVAQSEKFPTLHLTGPTSVTVTCISHKYLCDKLAKKGGAVTKGPVDKSVNFEMPKNDLLKLNSINLCGYQAVTPNLVLHLNDENGIQQIVALNLHQDARARFETGAQSISLRNNKHAFPCSKNDGVILSEVLTTLFF